jgi:uncharacterized caspase-like protein
MGLMTRYRSRLFCLLCLLATVLAGSQALAEKRVALVIGNAAYQNTPALANPVNDAEDVAATLKRVGFEVTLETNLDRRGMGRAVAQFARDAQDADAALFYFAGHGLQHRGTNYLMPTDARLEDQFGLNFEMARVEDILHSLDQARGVKILILDACRSNPLMDRLASRMAKTRDFSPTRGLARLDANQGMIIAYATQADRVAADGSGRNSPFTSALVEQITEPGLEIGGMFRRVAAQVHRTTKGRQLPELSVSLLGEFYFNRIATDAEAWAKLRGVDDPDGLRAFLKQYPKSPLAVDIRDRLAAVERAERDRQAREQQAQRERREREKAEQDRLERLQLAREQQAKKEQQEREKAEQGRLERERLAREKQEREKTQQAVAADPQPNPQIALLTPPTVPEPPPLSGVALIREIKKELTRVGCYRGPIDDRWSTTATQSSIKNFVKYAGLSSAPSQARIEFLDTIRGRSDRVCPLECSPRQVEQEGRCVAKTCSDGERLAANGSCIALTKQQPVQKNSGAQGSDRKCFVLAGKAYCQ